MYFDRRIASLIKAAAVHYKSPIPCGKGQGDGQKMRLVCTNSLNEILTKVRSQEKKNRKRKYPLMVLFLQLYQFRHPE